MNYYGRQVGIAFASAEKAAAHFLSASASSEVDPHPLFSMVWYRQRAASPKNKNALLDFIEYGHLGRNDPHPLFISSWYIAKNRDRLPAGANPLSHYLTEGWIEKCPVHPLFDDVWYRETNPDIGQAHLDAYLHFVAWGAGEGRSPSPHFDTAWYSAKYRVLTDPLTHYLTEGAAKGYDPSPRFDTVWYLKANPDVARSGLNPLVHFADVGHARGLLPAPLFKLDKKFGLPKEEFDEWRSEILRHRLQPSKSDYDSWLPLTSLGWQKPPETSSEKSALRFVVRIKGPSGEHSSDVSAEAVRKASGRLGLNIAIYDGGLDSMAAGLPEDAFVLFIQEGDILDDLGLKAFLAGVRASTRLCVFDMFYTASGSAYPIILPGFNPLHIKTVDCTFSRFAIKGSDLSRVLRLVDGIDDRAVLVAALDNVMADEDVDALVHCPAPILQVPDLSDDIHRMREAGVSSVPVDISGLRGAKVSIVICTKEKGLLLKQLLIGLLTHADSLIADIIVVSNQTTNMYALHTFKEWSDHAKVRILAYEKPFNFSDQSNIGVAASTGEFILLLNDDIVPITKDWLQHLLAPFADPKVGITGPLLLYPNEAVQHGGMYLGAGSAHHTLRHALLPDQDYLFMATHARDVSVVTGAALMMRRSLFEDLNGLDAQLASIYQDVDLCLRVSKLDFRILYIPRAILLHMESVTLKPMIDRVGSDIRLREISYFKRQHGEETLERDEFHSPCFNPRDDTLRSLQTRSRH